MKYTIAESPVTLIFIREETIIINSLFKNKYPETCNKIYSTDCRCWYGYTNAKIYFPLKKETFRLSKTLQQGRCWCPHPAEACPEPSGSGEGDVGDPGAAVGAALYILLIRWAAGCWAAGILVG